MLAELSIKNFAIIDDLAVSFEDGFSVITGETGAGKSILINAVNLLLGARATGKMVRTGEESAWLMAHFRLAPDSGVAARLVDAGHDLSDGLLVERVISARDRHRVAVNGRPATSGMLTEITESLASIAGQHAHQALLSAEAHLLYLDRFAGLLSLRGEVAGLFEETREALDRVRALKRKAVRQEEERELLAFQQDEIERAAVRPGEDRELEADRTRLANAKTLFDTASFAEEDLYSAEGAVSERLGAVQKALIDAAALDQGLAPFAEAVSQALYAVEDAAAGLRDYAQSVTRDEGLLEEAENRLFLLNRLKKKYGGDLEAVLSRLEEIRASLAGLDNLAGDIRKAGEEVDRLAARLRRKARDLSRKRLEAADRFCRAVEGELADLGMENTRFTVDFSPVPPPPDPDHPFRDGEDGIEATGLERAAFVMAPNVGEEPRPLKDIASGGELSRVVLALMAILSKNDGVSTVIFDEVDAGVGGRVADSVAHKLNQLARIRQVICITHLPQIAARAARHYRIEKTVEGGRTRARVAGLSGEERVREVARMLAGGRVSETSLSHARELLEAG